MSYIVKEEAEAFFSNARKRMRPEYYKTSREYDLVDNVLLNAEQFIHSMKAADVRSAKEGRWEQSAQYDDCLICSNCKGFYLDINENIEIVKFCPNFGADMTEKKQ